jgi:sec-independent protein translocase protein TatC
VICGLIFASPVVFSQIWRFVAPGLYRHEKRVILPFTFLSSLCFFSGAAFGYFVVFPPAFRFFVSYNNSYLTSLPTATEYLSLALYMLLAFGIIFEMPIFMVLLARLGVVTPAGLRRHRRYAVLINFIAAAILTPTPDVVNQLIMAVPLLILYEVSIIAVRLFGGGKKDKNEKEQGGAADAEPPAA